MLNETQEKSRVTKRYSGEEQKKKLEQSAKCTLRQHRTRLRDKLLGAEDRRVLEDRAARELAEKFACRVACRFAGRKDKIRVSVGGFADDPRDWEVKFRVEDQPYKAAFNNAPPISGEDLKLHLDKLRDELRRDPGIEERFRAASKRARAEDAELAKNEATLKAFLKSSGLPERVKIRDLLKD
jgi:hypothetical protein